MNNSIPEVVYHYTSPEAIFSILHNKTLWFTDAGYLNDKSENKKSDNDDMYRYVLSTSLDSDGIALWNYYVKNGSYQGYNLGININSLALELENDIQTESLPIKLEHREVLYINNPAKNDLFAKSEGFSCEKEYRFILSVPKGFKFNEKHNCALKKNLKFTHNFRVGNSGVITPYIEWNFSLDIKSSIFTRITLAPMIEEELAIASFKRFLVSKAQQHSIISSSIKVRF